jgi:hypothetical protein
MMHIIADVLPMGDQAGDFREIDRVLMTGELAGTRL